MELIAAILIAGPLGYLCATSTRARALYLVVWAVVFPIQTIVVHADSPGDISAIYFVLNAVILAAGLGLNAYGAQLRQRRKSAVVTS
jgi:hypothetical protein